MRTACLFFAAFLVAVFICSAGARAKDDNAAKKKADEAKKKAEEAKKNHKNKPPPKVNLTPIHQAHKLIGEALASAEKHPLHLYGGHAAKAVEHMKNAIKELDESVKYVKAHPNQKGKPGAKATGGASGPANTHIHFGPAIGLLHQARSTAGTPAHVFGGHRAKAMEHMVHAINQFHEAVKYAETHKGKPETFNGMILATAKGSITIKNSAPKGDWKSVNVDGKTKIFGLGVKSFNQVKKGQIVTVHYTGKHAAKLEVVKHAPKAPPLIGKKETFHGTVDKFAGDHYGNTGDVWVKNDKGQTKQFHIHNETIIDWKQKGKTGGIADIWGLKEGDNVKITHQGKEATHIDFHTK